MRRTCIAACFINLSLLTGCVQHLVISKPGKEPTDGGFAYSLPMGQLYLQASRTLATDDDANKTDQTTPDATKQATNLKVKKAKAAKAAKTPAPAAKPDASKVKASDPPKWNETVSFSALPIAADPSATYVGYMYHDSTRDDNVTLSIAKGLITTTTITSTDQKPGLIITLADTAITFASGISKPPTPAPNLVAAEPCKAFSYAWIFDPFDEAAVAAIKTDLATAKASFTINVGSGPSGRPIGQREKDPGDAAVNGLVYRAATPVTVSVVKVDPLANLGQGAKAAPDKVGTSSSEDSTAPLPIAGSGPLPNSDVAPGPAIHNGAGGKNTGPHLNTQPAPLPGANPAVGTAERKANPGAPAKPVVAATPPAATCDLASSPKAQAWQTFVPDTTRRYHVSSLAGPFTKTSLTYGFTDGMLTQYTVDRPSEVAAIAGIPVRIANDIMTIPASIVKMRVDYDTQAVAKINGDASVREAKIKQGQTIANAEAAVVNAQSSLANARINDQSSLANAQAALVDALDKLRAARVTAAANSAAAPSP